MTYHIHYRYQAVVKFIHHPYPWCKVFKYIPICQGYLLKFQADCPWVFLIVWKTLQWLRTNPDAGDSLVTTVFVQSSLINSSTIPFITITIHHNSDSEVWHCKILMCWDEHGIYFFLFGHLFLHCDGISQSVKVLLTSNFC